MKIESCPFCKGEVKVTELHCDSCDLSFAGSFYSAPLLSLSEEDQLFVELFILASGSLKEMAETYSVTYPTIRSRLDGVLERLRGVLKTRVEFRQKLLEQVEKGEISAEHAAKIISGL